MKRIFTYIILFSSASAAAYSLVQSNRSTPATEDFRREEPSVEAETVTSSEANSPNIAAKTTDLSAVEKSGPQVVSVGGQETTPSETENSNNPGAWSIAPATRKIAEARAAKLEQAEQRSSLRASWGSVQAVPHEDLKGPMRENESISSFLQRVRVSDVIGLFRNLSPIDMTDEVYLKFTKDWAGKLLPQGDGFKFSFTGEPSEEYPKMYTTFKIRWFNPAKPDGDAYEEYENSGIADDLRKSAEYPEALFVHIRSSMFLQLYRVPNKELIVGNVYVRWKNPNFAPLGTLTMTR